MKQVFDYLQHVAYAATVCNRDGVVIYQNSLAISRDGNVLGMNLFNCHNEKSKEIIKHLIETGESNTYKIIKQGQKRLIHQAPWYETDDGYVAGLIKLSITLPDECPTYNRDKN